MSTDVQIFIDGDACPVKDEIYRVTVRHGVPAVLVSNSYIRIPEHALISRQIVTDGFDAADDWIAERAHARSVVITADILLALPVGAGRSAGCLEEGHLGAIPCAVGVFLP